MVQPTKKDIENKINKLIEKTITREEVTKWATNYVDNEDVIGIDNLEDWNLLISICAVDLLVQPDEYLYSIEDIKQWIQK